MNESPNPASKGAGALIVVVLVALVAWFAVSAMLGNDNVGSHRVECTSMGPAAEYGEDC